MELLVQQLNGDDSPSRVLSLIAEGIGCYKRCDYAQAKALLQQSLDLSRTIGDRRSEADSLKELTHVDRYLADFPALLTNALLELAIRKELEDLSGEASACNSVGSAYYHLGELETALSYYRSALTLRETLADPGPITASLNNVGGIYGELGDYGMARSYHLQCVERSRQQGNVQGEIYFLSNLAGDHSHLGCLSEALSAGHSALDLARHHQLRSHEGLALESLADVYARGERLAEAQEMFEESEKIARELSDVKEECRVLACLGEVCLKRDQPHKAETAFNRVVEIAEAGGMKVSLYAAFAGLSEIFEKRGDSAGALTYYKKYCTLEKEVFNENADKRSKALMIQMQVERTQQEAELHRIKNVELAEANHQLQQQAKLLQQQAEEMRAQADELARQAMEDGLTGLANRRSLEGFLARQFTETARHTKPLTVVLADIDHFKQINDHFGHQIGDEVLMTMAKLMRRTCRSTDLAARYGGEEFALVLPQTTAVEGQVLCERLRRTVEEHSWSTIKAGLSVTLSLGLSDDLSVGNYERLLGQADAQLYRAKESGRNQVCFAGKTTN
jgi:diguanylate cyclase (GGDEF)-like protein